MCLPHASSILKKISPETFGPLSVYTYINTNTHTEFLIVNKITQRSIAYCYLTQRINVRTLTLVKTNFTVSTHHALSTIQKGAKIIDYCRRSD